MPEIHIHKKNKFYQVIKTQSKWVFPECEIKDNGVCTFCLTAKQMSFNTEFFRYIEQKQSKMKLCYKFWNRLVNKDLNKNILNDLSVDKTIKIENDSNTYIFLADTFDATMYNLDIYKHVVGLSKQFHEHRHNKWIDHIMNRSFYKLEIKQYRETYDIPEIRQQYLTAWMTGYDYEYHSFEEEYQEYHMPLEFVSFYAGDVEKKLDFPYKLLSIRPVCFYRFPHRNILTNIDSMYFETKAKLTKHDYIIYELIDTNYIYDDGVIREELRKFNIEERVVSALQKEVNKNRNKKNKEKKKIHQKQNEYVSDGDETDDEPEPEPVPEPESEPKPEPEKIPSVNIKFNHWINQDKKNIKNMIIQSYNKKSKFYELVHDSKYIFVERELHSDRRQSRYLHFNMIVHHQSGEESNTYHVYCNEDSIIYYTEIRKEYC